MLVNLEFFFRLLACFSVGTVGLVNRYHPGYIVKFLQESEKIPWAESICSRLNMGNPYHSDLVDLPIDLSSCPRADSIDWTIVKLKDLDDPELMMRHNFPIPVKSPVLFSWNWRYRKKSSFQIPIIPVESFYEALLSFVAGNYRKVVSLNVGDPVLVL